jgi:hypothetical protein
MFTLIFAITIALVLIVKYYELIKYKDKLNNKNILFLILITLFVIAVFLEKIFKVAF